ncbi:TRAP transporter small permease subunit [candidate division KSB1 bacterium]|nr:TRAP transporter small permease subunit [candidate division KSB1 bacterium]
MFSKIKLWLDRSLETLTGVSMGVLVLDVTWQVITRFILKQPSSWTEELATFLVIWVGLLGSAVALNRRAHLGIDYFVGKLSTQKRLIAEVFVYLCTGFFSIFVLFIGGVRLVSLTFMQNQTTPALGIKMGYIYLAIPIAGFFIAMYSIEFLVETLRKFKEKQDKPDAPIVQVD